MATPEPRLDLLRPRSVGELLSTTVALLMRHSGLFLSVTLLTALVIPPLVTGLHAVIVRELGQGKVLGAGEALRTAAPRFRRRSSRSSCTPSA
jgi:hypothetical protein